jgi:hypothetical protein
MKVPLQKRIAVIRRGLPSEAIRATNVEPNDDAEKLVCPFTRTDLRFSSIKKLGHVIVSDDRCALYSE